MMNKFTRFWSLTFCSIFSIYLSSCQTSPDHQQNTEGFTPIFDGETLNGWEGDTILWRVENRTLVGEITPEIKLENNSFLIWKEGMTEDFELKFEYKISEAGNSGVNYRSERVEGLPYALRGYQADIDGKNQWTGQNYEERGRAILAFRGQRVTLPTLSGSIKENVKNNVWTGAEVTESLGDKDSLATKINDGWNEMHIIAKGNHLQHFVNGILMVDITDNDTVNRKLSGLLGVQVHRGPPMKAEFRNILFKEL
ncbi:DUF1080 domain-containing protein [soil metagenome]